jgi:16S rRNA (cytosine967-C5)-methyltransferase
MPPAGLLVAADVRHRRMSLLRRSVDTAAARNIRLVQADLLATLPFRPIFDCVIVDAPCSGLGTLRRDPDIRWRRQESDLVSLAASQRVMLAHAAAMVRPGGRLVYATCSSEPEENEGIAEAFLREASEFGPVDARSVHPQLPPAVVDARGHLRTTPDEHGLEAFFGAVFARRASERPAAASVVRS